MRLQVEPALEIGARRGSVVGTIGVVTDADRNARAAAPRPPRAEQHHGCIGRRYPQQLTPTQAAELRGDRSHARRCRPDLGGRPTAFEASVQRRSHRRVEIGSERCRRRAEASVPLPLERSVRRSDELSACGAYELELVCSRHAAIVLDARTRVGPGLVQMLLKFFAAAR